ncbi:hypothetical protein D5086_020776 [Populus alba]|uniref:Uncharacterized protein n=1 Tax=Populus alba TaxID=43335 RepID=A0ACC4BLM0_POPAL
MESSSSSSSVLNPMVSPEEFKIFHTIDRTLYTRLVVNLNRDPADSMQVMALWIWLEREARVINPVLYCNSNAAGVYGQTGISRRFMWPNAGHPGFLPGYDPYDLAFQRQILNTENIAGGKAKFTINGKHAWARKYVRKNLKSSSPSKSPTSPQPTSPDTGSSSLN